MHICVTPSSHAADFKCVVRAAPFLPHRRSATALFATSRHRSASTGAMVRAADGSCYSCLSAPAFGRHAHTLTAPQMHCPLLPRSRHFQACTTVYPAQISTCSCTQQLLLPPLLNTPHLAIASTNPTNRQPCARTLQRPRSPLLEQPAARSTPVQQHSTARAGVQEQQQRAHHQLAAARRHRQQRQQRGGGGGSGWRWGAALSAGEHGGTWVFVVLG